MTISDLSKFENWKGKSPVEIRKHVFAAGGWSWVFARIIGIEMGGLHGIPIPKTRDVDVLPEWPSRVRNYFNETPISLKLLGSESAQLYMQRMKNRLPTHIRLPGFSWVSVPVGLHAFALTGFVYLDENRKPWFEIDKVGSIYHFAGDVTWGKKAAAALATYNSMPVFKYISPDGTGGSPGTDCSQRQAEEHHPPPFRFCCVELSSGTAVFRLSG